MLAARYDDGVPSVEHPWELIDDNKVRAALVGIEGKLIDFDRGVEVPGAEIARGVLDELGEHAQELGREAELEAGGPDRPRDRRAPPARLVRRQRQRPHRPDAEIVRATAP